ncbi:MAG: hypothetical protein M1496_00375 [Candidatus Thermoplasmatota archaeon]|jgi:IS30 family transposase|nr:hypothetical protein [Candidatus Thermoplasmatota archaeon]
MDTEKNPLATKVMDLREKGYSTGEIAKMTGHLKSVVWKTLRKNEAEYPESVTQSKARPVLKIEQIGKLQAEAEVKIDKAIVHTLSNNAVDDISRMMKDDIIPIGTKTYIKYLANRDKIKELGYYNIEDFYSHITLC